MGADPGDPFRVALVGLGPKGLFALERLLDHAWGLPAEARMQIDLFEPHPVPGAGPVYDPGQPAYLRMNFAAEHIDMWWPSSQAVPPGERKSFAAWANARRTCAGDADYPSRALVGHYLADGFAILCRHLPPSVRVNLRAAAVEEARPHRQGWTLRAGDSLSRHDEVLVAIGHQGPSDSSLAIGWTHAAPLVPAVFPVERRLAEDRVPAGARVAIRGFALTFIDAALALTEGRGGSFVPLDHPYRLRYVPGKDDARLILPFSRSGRPLLAKPGGVIAARARPALAGIAERGRARIDDIGGIADLYTDLLPILAATTCSNLVAVAGERAGGSLGVAAGRWLAEAAGGVAGAETDDPAAAIEHSLAVAAGLIPPGLAWALGHTWRTIYPALVARLGGDGLAGRDWPAFLRLSAEMERVSSGPPPLNASKLLALIEAGRVDLNHLRGATLESEGGRTRLRSARAESDVDVVVDAVLPGPGALGQRGLLAQLVAGGYARIPSGRRGLEVASNAGCRGADGSVTPGLSSVGRPTEDSVIGNDTLSRGLHPHAERWARRVAERCRAQYLAEVRDGSRRRAPA